MGCDDGAGAEYRLAVGCQCDGSLALECTQLRKDTEMTRYKIAGLLENSMQSNVG